MGPVDWHVHACCLGSITAELEWHQNALRFKLHFQCGMKVLYARYRWNLAAWTAWQSKVIVDLPRTLAPLK